jgi:hypothetical protein
MGPEIGCLEPQALGVVLDEIVYALIGEAFGAKPAAFGNAALSGAGPS